MDNLLKSYEKDKFEQIIRNIMNIIGRKSEIDKIKQCIASTRPEFMVVYGRRRVGKTYLIKEYFNNRFSFYATGVLKGRSREQLKAFNEALIQHGHCEKKAPADWFEAFRRLRSVLENESVVRDPESGRIVVFLDEVPWMDTARSDFRPALDYFWNGWGSSKTDLLLIVCGSATSWIINNILSDSGGFYNRVTRQLHLNPFSLSECEKLLDYNGIAMNRRQVLDCYMILGGIPYYLNLLDKRLSLAQNIDSLIFDPSGELYNEYDHLFRSLFKKYDNHMRLIEALAKKNYGMMRTELIEEAGVSNGEGLTKALSELEECGFIRKYRNYTKSIQSSFYQIIDPFVLFVLRICRNEGIDSWVRYSTTPAYYSWRGNAFETVCLNHIDQIKSALGISGVSSAEYAWRSKVKKGGAQIDLLINRRDDVINICEMKYSDEEYEIDASYGESLIHKRELFRNETDTNKSLFLTLITVSGLKKNSYADSVQNIISGDALFV